MRDDARVTSKRKAFVKVYRLRNAAEFRKVYEQGSKRISQSFVLFLVRNDLDFSRFGLTLPRKLGKAHERNRIKRRIREILRLSRTTIPAGFDYVVNPRRPAAYRPYTELRAELLNLLAGEK